MAGGEWRRVTLQALLARRAGRTLLDDRTLAELDSRGRALAFDAVQGVARNLFLLDTVLRRFLDKPLRSLQPRVREILRLGVFEILFHERLNVAASVRCNVDLVGASRPLRGLVNAVLRRVAGSFERLSMDDAFMPRSREIVWVGPGRCLRFDRPVLPDPMQDPVAHFSHHYSLTRLFVETFLFLLPLEFEFLFRSLDTPRPPALRPTWKCEGGIPELKRLLSQEGIREVRRRGRVLEIHGAGHLQDLDVLGKGLAVVQDRCAAEVAPFVGARPGERVLDLCAAPGGKTLHLAERMRDEGEVVAADVDADRLRLVEEGARRLSLSCVRTLPLHPGAPELEGERFDRVLVDVPCSNTGVLMRKVEARYRVDGEHLESLAGIQTEVLERGGACLHPGGTLVYATCSILPAENQLLVRRFLAVHPEFRLLEERLRYPHRTLRDGGYMARMVLEG